MEHSTLLRDKILSNRSRLLERQLYLTQFEKQDQGQFIKALLAYQNPDGGFGNGIEPDLNTPESTAIGLETALYYLDCQDYMTDELAGDILGWIGGNLQTSGCLEHPPAHLSQYPHQPWWTKGDENRVFAVMGLLKKLGVEIPGEMERKVSALGAAYPLPESLEEYDYPLFLYALQTKDFPRRKVILEFLQKELPQLSHRKPSQHILFTRYWKFFHGLLDREFLRQERERLMDQLRLNGELPEVYPELPWWHSIFCLDTLIALETPWAPN